jgi:hypothetical protein
MKQEAQTLNNIDYSTFVFDQVHEVYANSAVLYDQRNNIVVPPEPRSLENPAGLAPASGMETNVYFMLADRTLVCGKLTKMG